MMLLVPVNLLSTAAGPVDLAAVKEYLAVRVLLRILSLHVHMQVRALGLAYTLSLGHRADDGLFVFRVTRANSPLETLVQFRSIMRTIHGHLASGDSGDIVTARAICESQSALVYELVGEMASFSGAFAAAARKWQRGMPMDAQEVCDAVNSVTMDDLRAGWMKHFRPLMTGEGTLLLATVPVAGLSAFKTGLERDFSEVTVMDAEALEAEVAVIDFAAVDITKSAHSELLV